MSDSKGLEGVSTLSTNLTNYSNTITSNHNTYYYIAYYEQYYKTKQTTVIRL